MHTTFSFCPSFSWTKIKLLIGGRLGPLAGSSVAFFLGHPEIIARKTKKKLEFRFNSEKYHAWIIDRECCILSGPPCIWWKPTFSSLSSSSNECFSFFHIGMEIGTDVAYSWWTLVSGDAWFSSFNELSVEGKNITINKPLARGVSGCLFDTLLVILDNPNIQGWCQGVCLGRAKCLVTAALKCCASAEKVAGGGGGGGGGGNLWHIFFPRLQFFFSKDYDNGVGYYHHGHDRPLSWRAKKKIIKK